MSCILKCLGKLNYFGIDCRRDIIIYINKKGVLIIMKRREDILFESFLHDLNYGNYNIYVNENEHIAYIYDNVDAIYHIYDYVSLNTIHSLPIQASECFKMPSLEDARRHCSYTTKNGFIERIPLGNRKNSIPHAFVSYNKGYTPLLDTSESILDHSIACIICSSLTFFFQLSENVQDEFCIFEDSYKIIKKGSTIFLKLKDCETIIGTLNKDNEFLGTVSIPESEGCIFINQAYLQRLYLFHNPISDINLFTRHIYIDGPQISWTLIDGAISYMVTIFLLDDSGFPIKKVYHKNLIQNSCMFSVSFHRIHVDTSMDGVHFEALNIPLTVKQ